MLVASTRLRLKFCATNKLTLSHKMFRLEIGRCFGLYDIDRVEIFDIVSEKEFHGLECCDDSNRYQIAPNVSIILSIDIVIDIEKCHTLADA